MAIKKRLRHTHKSNYYPWRCCNDATFLVDGIQFFPEMLNAINEAQESVFMEMYLFESGQVADRFIQAFSAAAQRGVSVLLLVDAYGGLKLLPEDRKRMINAGVHYVEYNPLKLSKWIKNLFRTHRKILIIDGKQTFTGGFGLTDEFDGEAGWRETAVKVRGEVNKDWLALFADNFKRWSDYPIPQPPELFYDKGKVTARVAYTAAGHHLEIKKTFLSRIYNSRHRVWLASAYFVPSRRIRKFLRKAARRGRDVRLLLPGPVTDHPAVRYASQRYYAKLLRHGVRIFEYQERFSHTKMILIDNWFSIGSANMDRWNFRWNLEANQELKGDPATILAAKEILLNDFAQSKEILYQDWKNRSRLQRFIEWFWGKVDELITGQR